MLILRLVALLAAGGFGFAAYLQHDDPDWQKWVAVYGAAAAVCLLFALKKLVALAKGAATLVALGALGLAGYLAIDVFKQREFTFNEAERETLGLLVVGVVMLVVVFAGRKKKHKGSKARRDEEKT